MDAGYTTRKVAVCIEEIIEIMISAKDFLCIGLFECRFFFCFLYVNCSVVNFCNWGNLTLFNESRTTNLL